MIIKHTLKPQNLENTIKPPVWEARWFRVANGVSDYLLICPECGATVQRGSQDIHTDWHLKLTIAFGK